MIVPLMIWSARIEIDSQAWRTDTSIASRDARRARRRGSGSSRRRRAPGWSVPSPGPRGPRPGTAGEGGAQHHPLDADVHHAGPLVHDAAQGPERDRGGQRDDDRRDHGDGRDEIADQLEQDPDDGDASPGTWRSGPSARPTRVRASDRLDRRRSPSAARIRNRCRTTMSAARNSRMIAWMTSTISAGMPANDLHQPGARRGGRRTAGPPQRSRTGATARAGRRRSRRTRSRCRRTGS